LPGGEKLYTFGIAAICWAIWKARNILCFEKKMIKSPFDIIFSAYALMKYWACLSQGSSHEAIKEGVGLMVQTAIKLLKAQDGGRNMKTLADGGATQPDSDEAHVPGDARM
jgi:hypothetical protein